MHNVCSIIKLKQKPEAHVGNVALRVAREREREISFPNTDCKTDLTI
jgi:hypothetical protein